MPDLIVTGFRTLSSNICHCGAIMKSQQCDVAIIGAGPYGLSVAAHLRGTGVTVRIFGKAMDTWRSHMPEGMMLKSEGFASNLSAPDRVSTLKDYCASNRQIGRASCRER